MKFLRRVGFLPFPEGISFTVSQSELPPSGRNKTPWSGHDLVHPPVTVCTTLRGVAKLEPIDQYGVQKHGGTVAVHWPLGCADESKNSHIAAKQSRA